MDIKFCRKLTKEQSDAFFIKLDHEDDITYYTKFPATYVTFDGSYINLEEHLQTLELIQIRSENAIKENQIKSGKAAIKVKKNNKRKFADYVDIDLAIMAVDTSNPNNNKDEVEKKKQKKVISMEEEKEDVDSADSEVEMLSKY